MKIRPSVMAMAMLGLLSGVASAQEAIDYEKTMARYSVRDYVFSALPERGYDYYQIADNASFVHLVILDP